MLNAYSLDITVPATSSVPLNNITLEKGCTAVLSAPATINLNKRGVYLVEAQSSSAAAATIALSVNGVILPDTQRTGASNAIVRPVQVSQDNTCCCSSSPVTVQVVNPTDTSATYSVVSVTVTKIC